MVINDDYSDDESITKKETVSEVKAFTSNQFIRESAPMIEKMKLDFKQKQIDSIEDRFPYLLEYNDPIYNLLVDYYKRIFFRKEYIKELNN